MYSGASVKKNTNKQTELASAEIFREYIKVKIETREKQKSLHGIKMKNTTTETWLYGILKKTGPLHRNT